MNSLFKYDLDRLNNVIMLFGCDGSGKTTLLNNLERKGFKITSFLSYLNSPRGAIIRGSQNYFRYSELESKSPEKRASYLCTLLKDWCDSIIQTSVDNQLVIVDSYAYRYTAKEKIFNPQEALRLEDFNCRLPVPSASIYLKLPFVLSLQRNNKLHRSDVWPGIDDTNEAYIKLQCHVLGDIIEFLKNRAVPIYELNASLPAQSLVNCATELISDILPP